MASPTRLEMAFMEALNVAARANDLKPLRYFVRIVPEHDRVMTSVFAAPDDLADQRRDFVVKTKLTEIAGEKNSLDALAAAKIEEVMKDMDAARAPIQGEQ
jgi:hypothetical protein